MKKYLALLLSVLAVSSCTIVDTGGAVDNVGREIPVNHDLVLMKKHSRTTYPLYTTKDGKRYIKLRCHYLPARAKLFNSYMVGGCPVEAHERFYSSLYNGKPLTFYAEIEGECPYKVKWLIPESDFSLNNVTVSQIKFHEEEAQQALRAHLPEHRNTLNMAVQPIRWVADVADIPLSIIATPINWLILPTGYSLWEL